MNYTSPRIFVITVGVLLSALLCLAAPNTKASNYAARTKGRIDTLVNRRLKPEPLPDVLPNPFQLSGVVTPTNPTTVPTSPVEPAPPSNDSEALAHYAATLKIGGIVQLNGRVQLVINQSPYREGDLVFVDNKNAVIYLQIIRLTPSELTLGLNQAVQTIKLKTR
jgi:hypothetical protein